MSAYEKPRPVDMIIYHATGALHELSPFGPHHALHMLQPAGLAGTARDVDFHYPAASEFSHHQSFVGHQPSLLGLRMRESSEITYATPEGTQGTTILLYLQTMDDLFALPTTSFSIVLGSKHIEAIIQPVGDLSGPLRQYVVSGVVPPFIATGWHSFSVPLSLRMDCTEGTWPPQAVPAGHFLYNNSQATSSNQSPKLISSAVSNYDLGPPPKKMTNPQLQIQDQNMESFDHNQTSQYSPFVPTPPGSCTEPGHTRSASPRPSGHHYSTSSASQVPLTALSPQTPAWSPSFTTVKTERSPPLTPVSRPASAPSALKGAVPKLVRTSAIRQSSAGASSVSNVSMYTQTFNPYATYPIKAILKLNGDLDALAKDWTTEEFDARRRLVEFSRVQTGSMISTTFKVVAPNDRSTDNITISCIWWKEKKECFVTSVDIIYLLEALVGVRFTVEEKNRVRRNLEGFRPLTVSKFKADSEDFFKCIMGFPRPKPRNIEKDVKVFPWIILARALKKIISKYSVSYSSTTSAILTPAPSAYGSTDVLANADFVTTSMSAYPVTTTAGYLPMYDLWQGVYSHPDFFKA